MKIEELGPFLTECQATLSPCPDENCRDMFVEHTAYEAVSMVAEHEAIALAMKVHTGESTLIEAYEELATKLRPIFKAVGQEVPDEDNDPFREAIEQIVEAHAGHGDGHGHA